MSVESQWGGRLVLEKRRRLRGKARLRELDILILERFYEGRTIPQVADILRYTPSYVYRRFKRMPGKLKAMVQKDINAMKRQRLDNWKAWTDERDVG